MMPSNGCVAAWCRDSPKNHKWKKLFTRETSTGPKVNPLGRNRGAPLAQRARREGAVQPFGRLAVLETHAL